MDVRLLFLSLFVVVILLLALVFYQNEEKTGKGTVTLYIDFGKNGRLYTGNLTVWDRGKLVSTTMTENNTTIFEFLGISGNNLTVFSVLMKGAEWGNFSVRYSIYSSPAGIFIDSICEVDNDEKNWQYYINGGYGIRSCDGMPVEDGDIVRWVYR